MQEQSDKDVSSSNSAIDLKKILQDLHLVSEDGVLIEQRSKQESTSQRKKTVPKIIIKMRLPLTPSATKLGIHLLYRMPLIRKQERYTSYNRLARPGRNVSRQGQLILRLITHQIWIHRYLLCQRFRNILYRIWHECRFTMLVIFA